MGKIGDYIYLTWGDYEKGYQVKGQDVLKRSQAENIFNDKIKIIKDSFVNNTTITKAKELEDYYNLILYGLSENKQVDNENIQIAQDKLRKEVMEKLFEKFSPLLTIDENWKVKLDTNKTFNTISELTEITEDNFNSIEKVIKEGKNLIENIQKYIANLSDSPSKLIQELKGTGGRLSILKRKLTLLEKQKHNFKKITGTKTKKRINESQQLFYSTLWVEFEDATKNIKLFGEERENSPIGLITEINRIANAVNTLPAEAMGDALELALAQAPNMIQETLIKNMKGVVTGGKDYGTKTGISTDFFSANASVKLALKIKDESKKISNQQINGEYSQIIITNNTVQGKTDVRLTYENGDIANISAKNYNMSSNFGLGILSGAPLLSLIQNENNNPEDYVNHFLNVFGYKYENNSSTNIIEKKDNIYKTAYQSMKLLLFAKGLFDYNAFRLNNDNEIIESQNVDYFVVNDNSGKASINGVPHRVRVLSTEAIFNYMIKQKNQIDEYIEIKPDLEKGTWRKITKQKTIQERLNNIIAALYTDKISIHINKNKWADIVSNSTKN